MTLRRNTSSILLGLSLLALPSLVLAQVPTSVDPSLVERRFEDDQLPARAQPGAVPVVSVPTNVPSAEAARIRFTLRSVAIDGATVYTQDDFTPLFADKLGKEISLAEAQALAQAVTLKYRNDGYILSQAVLPEQTIEDGTLVVRVVEGYVSNVVVQGDVREGEWSNLVEGYADKLRQHRPIHISTMERYLLLMDDLPGATARSTVRPSATEFGAAELVVDMSHKAFEGALTVDNRGSRFIGPVQLTGTVVANSLFNMYDRTTLRGILTSQTDELKFIDLQHEQQLGHEGTRIILNASTSRTNPGYTLTPLDIEGQSDNLIIRLTHPIIRTRTENLNVRGVFDYRNTDTDILGADFSDDRLRSLRAGVAYDFADDFDGINLVDFQISQGLNILNASESGANRSVALGESDYTKFNADITRTHSLPYGLSLFTAASAQYSLDKLLSSEQFTIGGANFGSAYDPAELAGDHGAAARAELRYGNQLGWNYLDAYQAYGFYDIGKVWDKINTGSNTSLASTGAGVRMNFMPWLSGSAELAFPLTKQVSIEGDKDPRLFFSLTGRF